MRAMVVGAGPAGLMLGGGLAGLGADVVVVDRDGGPGPDGSWDRRGVMQFGHAHGFRPQVSQVLGARWPAALATWRAAGAEPVEIDVPGLGPVSGGMLSRRIVLERALRAHSGRYVRAGRPPGCGAAAGRARWPGRRRAGRRPGRRGRPGRGRDRAFRPAGSERDGARRRLRHRLRQPHLPAARRSRAGADDLADRVVRRLRRLPGHRLPARARTLLGGLRPPDHRHRC